MRKALSSFGQGDWLILQNEISGLPLILKLAAERGMHIALNPSPYDSELEGTDFSALDWLIVNETEAEQITGEKDPGKAWEVIHRKYPSLSLLVTMGSRGSTAFPACDGEAGTHHEEAVRADAEDTTGAGDDYTGYFIAGLAKGRPLRECMNRASRAAAIAVTRPGAAESIPWNSELD